MLCAFALAGCSYQLSSLFSKGDSGRRSHRLHHPRGGPERASAASAPPEIDLAYARAVAADALTRGGKDASVPWENPHTGAGGNITPLAAAYSEGGFTCRDFLASYVHGGSQAWLRARPAAPTTASGKSKA